MMGVWCASTCSTSCRLAAGDLGQGSARDLLEEQHGPAVELLMSMGVGDTAHILKPLEDGELTAVALVLARARRGGRGRLQDEGQSVRIAHGVEQKVGASGLEGLEERVPWDVEHSGMWPR
jgi:hypothetical protein